MKHIMLDLETMGNGPTAAVVAIGACEFDPRGDGVEAEKFYAMASLESAMGAGLTVDPSTILWWMQQDDIARKSTFGRDALSLGESLRRFNAWVYRLAPCAGQTAPSRADVAVWGNGATFDNVIIRSAFKAVGTEACWSFRNDKCYRTVTNLPGAEKVSFERSGTAHNALDDAITQALHLQKVYKALGL